MHGYEMPDMRMWLLLQRPALAAAAKPAGRHGTAEVPLGRLFLSLVGQWLIVGALARIALAPLRTDHGVMRALVKLVAGWIVLSVLGLLLLFWHLIVVGVGAREEGWRVSLPVLAGVVTVGALSVLGAVATYGLWTLREGGRRSALWYLSAWLVAGLAFALKWGEPASALVPLLFYGAPLLLLLMPRGRASFHRT